MQEKKLYLLAQFDKDTQNVLSGYYEMLRQKGFIGNQTKNIPYHFTLGSHSSGSVNLEQQLADDLERICAQTMPFDITMGYIGMFAQNVLFVAPNINFELLKLQQSFFPDYVSGSHPWSAHATILIDEPEAILKAAAIVTKNHKPFTARIESVALYEFFPARLVKECIL